MLFPEAHSLPALAIDVMDTYFYNQDGVYDLRLHWLQEGPYQDKKQELYWAVLEENHK